MRKASTDIDIVSDSRVEAGDKLFSGDRQKVGINIFNPSCLHRHLCTEIAVNEHMAVTKSTLILCSEALFDILFEVVEVRPLLVACDIRHDAFSYRD